MLFLVCFWFLFFLFWFYITRTRTMSLLQRSGIPGPKPNIILGNLLEMRNLSIIDYQKHLMQKFGKVVGYYNGARPTILVADIDLIKNIQTKDFKFFADRPELDTKFILFEKFNDGTLISATGELWVNIRKLITSSLSPSKLKLMTPLIDQSVETFIDIIRRNAETEVEFNFYPLAEKFTAEVTIKAAFGIENNIQTENKNKFFDDIQEFMSTPIDMKLYLIYNCFPTLFPLINWLRRTNYFSRRSGVRVTDKLSEIINFKKSSSSNTGNDILQALLDGQSTVNKELQQETGKYHLSVDIIKANAMLLYAAGYETTSLTIAIMAHHIVNFPNVQEKVQKEVRELYDREGKLDFNVLNELENLESVIKETLRLYHPVDNLVTRQCLQDYKYKEITIPKGSTIMIPVHPLQTDEEYWPNADKFEPTRFSSERKSEINPYAYQPFGEGPRNCPGMRFAFLEIKLLFAKLLLHYRLERTTKTEIGKLSTNLQFATLRPKYGVFVKAVKI